MAGDRVLLGSMSVRFSHHHHHESCRALLGDAPSRTQEMVRAEGVLLAEDFTAAGFEVVVPENQVAVLPKPLARPTTQNSSEEPT